MVFLIFFSQSTENSVNGLLGVYAVLLAVMVLCIEYVDVITLPQNTAEKIAVAIPHKQEIAVTLHVQVSNLPTYFCLNV